MSLPDFSLPPNWLYVVSLYYGCVANGESHLTFPSVGAFAGNTSTDWDNVSWPYMSTPKPSYATLVSYQQEALSSLGQYYAIANFFADHAQLVANTSNISSLSTAVTSLQSAPPSHNHAAADITSGSKTAAFISDFSEAAQDAVAAALSAEFVYNDAGNAISMRALTISSPSLAVNTARQASSSRWAFVSASVVVSATLSLLVGQEGVVTLEYADDSAFTTNVTTAQPSTSGNTAAVNISVTLTQKATATVCGFIPAGKYYRVKTTNVTGTPTYGTPSIQETLLTQGA